MDSADVISRIQQALSADHDPQIDVSGADCNFTTRVISTVFDGLRPVQRQQKILSAFADVLSDGRLHALSIEAYTPQEWQVKSQPQTSSTFTQLS